jgi:PAS domain S-box-containing protein
MTKENQSEMNDSKSLRVLMVEDSEDDALLIIHTLKKGGYDPVHERVETATTMLQALKDKTWDIILSDYKMPHFSGEQAIGLLKETNIDIPIIIVSGAIGEETAVECMRLGAHDYFVKNNLTRLCAAITREVGEAESRSKRKQADEALRQSEAQYRLLANHMKDTVWLMDMDLKTTYISPSVEKLRGYTFAELQQLPLDQHLTPASFQLAMETLSVEMPKVMADSTYFFSRILELEFYRKDGTSFFSENTFSLIRDERGIPVSFLGEGRDITDRKQIEAERNQSFEKIRKALDATVNTISMTVEMRDPYTAGHQQRVADLARSVGAEMGLSADFQDFIHTAAIIHDIGKIVIPSEMLSKPTKLTSLEFDFIKTHSRAGYDILKGIEFPWPVADAILQHHERMDGSGYPQGLKRNDILLVARIMAVADVIEAIASHRPYRPALGIDFALKEISANKGIYYDDAVVDACLKLFNEKGYKLSVSS